MVRVCRIDDQERLPESNVVYILFQEAFLGPPRCNAVRFGVYFDKKFYVRRCIGGVDRHQLGNALAQLNRVILETKDISRKKPIPVLCDHGIPSRSEGCHPSLLRWLMA